MQSSQASFSQCYFVPQTNYSDSNITFRNCVWRGAIAGGFAGLNLFATSWGQCANSNSFDGSGATVNNSSTFENNGATISHRGPGGGGSGWALSPSAFVYTHNSGRFWGPGAGYGIAIQTFTASYFTYVIVPTITGSITADVEASGVVSAYAGLPLATTARSSYIVNLA